MQGAIDRACACKLTLREGKSKPMNYAMIMMQNRITELMKLVILLTTQVEELSRKVKSSSGRFRAPRINDN